MTRFIVVTGLPASGKSTVGAAVAAALGLPLFDKDEILEALFEGLGTGDADWRTKLSRASDLVLQRIAQQSMGAVITSWWRHPLSQANSGTSSAWLSSLPGEVVEIYCRCNPTVAVERFFARSRHVGHLDGAKSREAELARFEQLATHGPLGLARVIDFNTEQAFDVNALLHQLAPPGANPSFERMSSSGLRPLQLPLTSNVSRRATVTPKHHISEVHMKRVTGIGGIFFKSADPKSLGAWYRDHLGLDVTDWGGAVFQWGGPESPPGMTIWSPFAQDTNYMEPSSASFMINFRVADLDALLATLRTEGCNVIDKTETSEQGKFGWVMDPEGNKIELWEPPAGQ
jgi:predicted enzyme related to lactoylglutathione lyase/gluconate kinase